MKKKVLFTIIDVILVAVVGLIFGFSCKDHIFNNVTSFAAFFTLLGALIIPALVYFLKDKINTANIVVSCLLVLGEVVANVVFIAKPEFELMYFAITQGVILGIYLMSLLAIIAFYKIDE